METVARPLEAAQILADLREDDLRDVRAGRRKRPRNARELGYPFGFSAQAVRLLLGVAEDVTPGVLELAGATEEEVNDLPLGALCTLRGLSPEERAGVLAYVLQRGPRPFSWQGKAERGDLVLRVRRCPSEFQPAEARALLRHLAPLWYALKEAERARPNGCARDR